MKNRTIYSILVLLSTLVFLFICSCLIEKRELFKYSALILICEAIIIKLSLTFKESSKRNLRKASEIMLFIINIPYEIIRFFFLFVTILSYILLWIFIPLIISFELFTSDIIQNNETKLFLAIIILCTLYTTANKLTHLIADLTTCFFIRLSKLLLSPLITYKVVKAKWYSKNILSANLFRFLTYAIYTFIIIYIYIEKLEEKNSSDNILLILEEPITKPLIIFMSIDNSVHLLKKIRVKYVYKRAFRDTIKGCISIKKALSCKKNT